MKAPGLRIKFLAVSLGMVALLGLASIAFIRTTLTSQLEIELQKRGVAFAEHLAEDSATPLLTENILGLQMLVLDHQRSEEDIEYIFIQGSDGKVLTHTFGRLFPVDLLQATVGDNRQAGTQLLETEKGRIIHFSAPVLKGQPAMVHVGFSAEPVRTSVDGITRNMLWITAIVLASGGILAIFFTVRITKPLADFAEAVKDLGHGVRGRKVPVTTGDEIGRLAEAFNHMMDDLQRTTVSRDQMEGLVQERTTELSEVNRTLSALIRLSPLAIIGLDKDGDVLIWNPAAELLFGWKAAEVVGGKNPIVPPDKMEEYRDLQERVVRGASYASIELQRMRKDGSRVIVSVSSALISDGSGRPVLLFGIFEDITSRKQVEVEILRLSRQKELILTCAGEGILGMDKEGNIRFINPAAADMMGWTEGELIGRQAHSVFHHSRPDGTNYPREDCALYRALKTGEVHHVRDELFWRRDGSGFPVEYITTPIVEHGEITGAVMVVKDISEMKQTEEGLRAAVLKAQEQKAKTDSIIAAIGDGINIQDREYRIQYQNAASRGFYGDHIGEYCYKAFQNRDQVCERCHLTKAFTDGKVHMLEQKRTTGQGTFYYEITASPLRNAEGAIIAGIELIRDVTDRRNLLDQLEAATNSLAVRVQEEVEKNRAREQAMQIQSRHAAMGEMIDNIAHQWRQPLNNLGLIIQGVKQKFLAGTLTPERLQEQVKLGMSLITYMSQTISDFTQFLRHDKALTSFRMRDVVATALTVTDISLKRNGVTVIADIDDEVTVRGFRNEYTQVVVNILNNARDIFLERGTENPVIMLRACRQDEAAILNIADNGGGIRNDVIEKIFTPNFTTKAPYRGTGIGLYMSKMIIERNMQGRLSVCNRDGGAEFRVEVRHGG